MVVETASNERPEANRATGTTSEQDPLRRYQGLDELQKKLTEEAAFCKQELLLSARHPDFYEGEEAQERLAKIRARDAELSKLLPEISHEMDFLRFRSPELQAQLEREEHTKDAAARRVLNGSLSSGETTEGGENETASEQPTLRVVSAEEFLSLDLRPREMVLGPILPTQGLAMVHSWRGVGKTHFSMGVAYAVASGGQFLKWTAPKPRKVFYVDGELPGRVFQERLASAVKAQEGEPPPGYFQVLNPDLQECGMPNLAEKEGQQLIEAHLDGIELLVLDNLSTLCRSGEENAGESWLYMQEWLLALRRKGVSVLMDHHSGKGGAQRGTSRREDILDTIVCLKHPADYTPSAGCRFEVHFEKCRSLYGTDAQPFEAKMETVDGRTLWTMRDIETVTAERIAALLADHLTQRQIAEELKISVGKVNKIVRQIRENQP